MPWKAPSGNVYRLCLLDTNALSEIVKNPQKEGRGFVETFNPESYVPCFTVYNLIELRRKLEVYKAFLKFFSKYPAFLLKTLKQIGEEEFDAYESKVSISPLFNAFSPLGHNSTYMLEEFIGNFFSTPEIAELEKNWRLNDEETLRIWLENKRNFSPKKSATNAVDAERYVKEAGIQTLIQLSPKWVQRMLENGHVPNLEHFPSLKVMLYSQYYRIFEPTWEPRPQEVTDVMIMAVSPYVDAVVTERFQAEVFKKVKNKMPLINTLEVATLKDLRKASR